MVRTRSPVQSRTLAHSNKKRPRFERSEAVCLRVLTAELRSVTLFAAWSLGLLVLQIPQERSSVPVIPEPLEGAFLNNERLGSDSTPVAVTRQGTKGDVRHRVPLSVSVAIMPEEAHNATVYLKKA